jgi:hypothetical protein
MTNAKAVNCWIDVKRITNAGLVHLNGLKA